jgi:hypothetical protein
LHASHAAAAVALALASSHSASLSARDFYSAFVRHMMTQFCKVLSDRLMNTLLEVLIHKRVVRI